MHRSPTSSRVVRFGVAIIALVALTAVGANSAMAKTKCSDQVVADWFNDGRVDKIYPLECYRQAIKSLPPDVVDYSNAKEEIGRALAFAKQGKPDPGGKDPTPPPTTSSPTGTNDTTPTGTNDTTPTGTNDAGTTGTEPQTTDTSGPSSVPIPLLVLGGLAVLLLAAGSAGYLRRRMGSNGDGDGTPPASA